MNPDSRAGVSSTSDQSLSLVLNSGMCIGCGACVAMSPISKSIIGIDQNGFFLVGDQNEHVLSNVSVCPFSGRTKNESQLADDYFKGSYGVDNYLGRYVKLSVGHVREEPFRLAGSSGGFGKWLLSELLIQDLVDTVIQVVEHQSNHSADPLFGYEIVGKPEQVLSGSKSTYYPVEMSQVLRHVMDTPGRYAITGVPCFIKAVRLLAEQDERVKERVKFCIGMFCGHMKSPAYAEMMAWQMGVEPDKLASIDFRGKIPGQPANVKGVLVESKDAPGEKIGPAVTRDLLGGGYNYGLFQHKACDFCDDVVAETADIAIGDAWLPEFITDGKGTSILIVRNPVIQELLVNGVNEGSLSLQPISAEKVIESQAGGFRHRREGLSYRLSLADKAGEWRPRKRVEAGSIRLSKKRKRIYQLRIQLREQSHIAFQKARAMNDFKVFSLAITPILDQYNALYSKGLLHRVKRGLLRRLNRLKAWGR